MTQLSGRLRTAKLVQRTAAGQQLPAATAGSNGRSYVRRLLATDLLVVAAASAVPALAVAADAHPGIELFAAPGKYAVAGVLLAGLWMLCLRALKNHRIGNIAVGMQEYKQQAYAAIMVAGLLGICIGLTGLAELRIFLVATVPAGLAGLLLGRWAWRLWLARQARRGFALSNVLIYGQAKDTPYAVRQISKTSGPAYRVVGVLLDGDANAHAEQDIRRADPTLPVSYGTGAIGQQAAAFGADCVLVAGPLAGGNQALQELGWELERTGTKLIVVSSLTGVASRRVRTSPVDGMPLLHVDLARFAGARYVLKRGFDLLFALLALLALSPVFLAIAALIRLDGPGKIFFKQERAGQDGRAFQMFKFRTMVENAEAQLAQLKDRNEGAGPLFKLKDDPRITRVGHWLRKHSLDELPQFLNVLRGEMSVVGPRPPLFSEVADYRGHTHRRLLLKPGVTGLWQVSGRSNLDWDESVRLDLYYAENWTVLSDLRIIWRTFRVMIKPDGAY